MSEQSSTKKVSRKTMCLRVCIAIPILILALIPVLVTIFYFIINNNPQAAYSQQEERAAIANFLQEEQVTVPDKGFCYNLTSEECTNTCAIEDPGCPQINDDENERKYLWFSYSQFVTSSAFMKLYGHLLDELSVSTLLAMYSNWMQGRWGDCSREEPSYFATSTWFKWHSWEGLRGKNRIQAQIDFMDLMVETGLMGKIPKKYCECIETCLPDGQLNYEYGRIDIPIPSQEFLNEMAKKLPPCAWPKDVERNSQ